MIHSPRRASLLLVLIASVGMSCTIDLNPLQGLGVADAASPQDSRPPDVGTPDAAPDATLPDAMPPDATPPDAMPPRCGTPGLPCCSPLMDCSVGLCYRGVCASFGGAYSEAPECPRTCATPNPSVAGCSCPPGFANERIEGLLGRGCTLLESTPINIGLCTAGGLSFGDYSGYWLSASEDGACAAECTTPHPSTADCMCPDGLTSLSFELDVPSTCGDYRSGTITFCLDRSSPTVSFAGAYRWDNLIRTDCGSINPLTGSCACPVDAREIELPVTRNGQIIPPITVCIE